jgi:hypothetical protein
MPAHRRPESVEELVHARPVFEWLNWHRLHVPCVLQAVGAEFFREGIMPVMMRLDRKYAHHALTDTRDFMGALRSHLGDRESELPSIDHDFGLHGGDPLLSAWLLKHGLWALLAASARWHDGMREHRGNPPEDEPGWPLVLGSCRIGDWDVIELVSSDALNDEGHRMCHCVATRWQDCAREGARIYSMRQDGGTGERATAQFNLVPGKTGAMRYTLYELRGPENDDTSRDCHVAAQHLADLLNRPERQFAIAQVIAAAQQARMPKPVRVWLDENTERLALALVAP